MTMPESSARVNFCARKTTCSLNLSQSWWKAHGASLVQCRSPMTHSSYKAVKLSVAAIMRYKVTVFGSTASEKPPVGPLTEVTNRLRTNWLSTFAKYCSGRFNATANSRTLIELPGGNEAKYPNASITYAVDCGYSTRIPKVPSELAGLLLVQTESLFMTQLSQLTTRWKQSQREY